MRKKDIAFSLTGRCYVCGSRCVITHHIYAGLGRREQSEKWRCVVNLCPAHHNMSNDGVHFNKALDTKLKQECERWCLKTYNWTIEQFIKEFRRNYLEEGETK